MEKIKIPVATDLNNIISQLNQKKKDFVLNQSNLHFEKWIFDALPKPLSQLLHFIDSSSKKDTAFLTILTILSALPKNYKVVYDENKEGCQLYFYLLGDPAQGKGSVAKYKKLGNLFHAELVENFKKEYADYKLQLDIWMDTDKKGDKPVKPIKRVLFLSGNSSKASLIKELEGNNGCGLIFETEADTLYIANKSDFGGFSDILRKGFHSENLSVNRVGFEDGAIEIEKVDLSVLLSSTLDQCFKLIPTYDNGLFSRFVFYVLPQDLKFKNVFEKNNTEISDKLSDKLANLFKSIGDENLHGVEKIFCLTELQKERFKSFFGFINDACVENGLIRLKGSINRLGLIFTRICMLLTYFRNYTHGLGDIKIQTPHLKSANKNILCNDIDFEIVLSMTSKLINHLLLVDSLYNKKNPNQQNSYMIHDTQNTKRYTNKTKLTAIDLAKKGMSYSDVAKQVLNNPNLKGTIHKWVTKNREFPVSETETATNKIIDVIPSLKSVNVSFFDSIKTNQPSEVFSLYNLLTCNGFKGWVDEVRMAAPIQRKSLKVDMPAFTVSGLFNEKRTKEFLQTHSGFICIDIDLQDNDHIPNFKTLKEELKNIINVAYIGESVSGQGYFVIFPIDETTRHEEYFNAIQEAFNVLGITIDKNCKDITRLRIVSYDEAFYMPVKATIISEVLEQSIKSESFEFVEHDRFESVVKEIEKRQIDITKSYHDWFAIGCSIANTFGEDGRKYFQLVSKFYIGYKETETQKQYSDCLKNKRENGYTLGTFFHLADKHLLHD